MSTCQRQRLTEGVWGPLGASLGAYKYTPSPPAALFVWFTFRNRQTRQQRLATRRRRLHVCQLRRPRPRFPVSTRLVCLQNRSNFQQSSLQSSAQSQAHKNGLRSGKIILIIYFLSAENKAAAPACSHELCSLVCSLHRLPLCVF